MRVRSSLVAAAFFSLFGLSASASGATQQFETAKTQYFPTGKPHYFPPGKPPQFAHDRSQHFPPDKLNRGGFSITIRIPPVAPYPNGGGVTVGTTAAVNLRFGPGAGYHVLIEIPQGQVVPLLGCTSLFTWCRTNYDGVTGWVSAAYLTPRPDRSHGLTFASGAVPTGVPLPSGPLAQ